MREHAGFEAAEKLQQQIGGIIAVVKEFIPRDRWDQLTNRLSDYGVVISSEQADPDPVEVEIQAIITELQYRAQTVGEVSPSTLLRLAWVVEQLVKERRKDSPSEATGLHPTG